LHGKKCGIDLKQEVIRLQQEKIVPVTQLTGLRGGLRLVLLDLAYNILLCGGLSIILINLGSNGNILPEAAPLHNWLIFIGIVFFILSSIGLVLLIYTKKIFRSFMIGMYILVIVSALVGKLYFMNSGYDGILSCAVVKSLIWIVYFVKSKRVRNTFVN